MARTRQKPKGSPERAVAYLRVSKEEQKLGPVAQAALIETWAKANGVGTVVYFVDNGVSGGAPIEKRPALLDAIAALGELGAGVLIFAKRDRLARDSMYAPMIERLAKRAGATVVSADGVGNGDSPEDRFVRGIMNDVAEYERRVIAARTKAGLDVMRKRGERIGLHAAFGTRLSRDGKHVEPDKREQRTMAYIRKLRGQTNEKGRPLPVREIVARLNRAPKKHPARGVKGWHPTTVVRILKEGEAQ